MWKEERSDIKVNRKTLLEIGQNVIEFMIAREVLRLSPSLNHSESSIRKKGGKYTYLFQEGILLNSSTYLYLYLEAG